MWTFSTRSVAGSTRHAIPSGSTHGALPGFQNRKWLSGSKASDSMFRSMPAKPAPGCFLFEAGGAAAVNEHIGVMHRARVTRPDLDRSYPARAR